MARLVAAEGEGGFSAGHGAWAQRPFESPLRKNTLAREIRVQIDSRYEFIDLVQKMAEDLCRVVRLGRGAAQNLGLSPIVACSIVGIGETP